jgi:hypothetical protein
VPIYGNCTVKTLSQCIKKKVDDMEIWLSVHKGPVTNNLKIAMLYEVLDWRKIYKTVLEKVFSSFSGFAIFFRFLCRTLGRESVRTL